MSLRRRRGDDGSALILTLLFLVIVALFVVPLVTFLDVAQRSNKATRSQRALDFATEGAIDAAVNRFRAGGSCEDYVAPWREDPDSPGSWAPVDDQELVVRCQQEAVTSAGPATKPVHSLLSLGTTADEDGVASTTGNLRVRGDVYSNSPRLAASGGSSINVTGAGSFVVEGTVSARGDCSPAAKVLTAPPSALRCTNGAGAADPARGRDPDYDKALTTVPAPGVLTVGASFTPVTGCPSDWRIDVWPGYYDDPAPLNALTDGTTCPGKVLWLHPGDYHFNFGFRAGTGTTWAVNDPAVNVVGGTPKGGWEQLATRPTGTQLPTPGGCRAEEDPGPGVQILLGGKSRLNVPRGKVELCASPSLDDQRIALYGHPGLRPVHTLVPTAFESNGFSAPGDAGLIGELPPDDATVRADLDAAGPAASITLKNYRRFVPKNALIDSAVVRIRHHRVGGGAVEVSVPLPEGCQPAPTLTPDVTWTVATIDLKERCSLTTGIPFLARDCSAACLSLQYVASLPAGGTATSVLDGIAIDVAYREPVTRKPSAALVPDPPGDVPFTNPAGAFQIDERPTTRTADADSVGAGQTAALKLAGYGEPRAQPGSSLDAAVLRIAHREGGGAGTVSVTVPGACAVQDLTWSDTAVEERVDLKLCGMTIGDLAGFTATFTAVGGTGGSEAHVDGIWLDLVLGPADPRNPTTHDGGAGGFADPVNALEIGEQPDALFATAGLDAAAATPVTTASITVGGFGTALPPGSKFESANLLVRHQEDSGDTPPIPPVVTVDAAVGGTPCVTGAPLAASPAAMTTAGVDLSSCPLADPSQLTVTYTVSLGAGGTTATETLDGIELDLRYRPPTVRRGALATTTTFSDVEEAKAVDDVGATVVLPVGDPPTNQASITLSDFGLPVPAGSDIEYARVRVVHMETFDGAVAPVLNVSASTDGTTACRSDAVSPSTTAPGTATFDLLALDPVLLTACDLTDPSQLAVTFSISLPPTLASAAAAVDGVELDLRFRPPAFDAIGDCAAGAPYTGVETPAACALVKVDPDGGATRFVVAGTVYAPSAALDVTLANVNYQMISRGVVGRTIRLGVTPVASYRRPALEVPPEAVLFSAHLARSLRPAVASPSGFTIQPDEGRRIDGVLAEAAIGGAGGAGPSASLLLSGYGTPSGAFAADPVLRVRHQDGAGLSEVKVTVTLTGAPARVFSSSDSPCQLCLSQGAPVEDLLPLTGVTPSQLQNATVTFQATADSPGPCDTTACDAALDGIEIVEVLSGPKLRARVQFEPERTTVVGWSVLR